MYLIDFFFNDSVLFQDVVVTCMAAVAVFTAPTIQTCTQTILTVYGTSDQAIKLFSWRCQM